MSQGSQYLGVTQPPQLVKSGYGAWSDASDDEKYRNIVTGRMRAMEPVSTGIQLADENLINRPRHFLTDENFRRVDEIRTAFDPDNLFVSWLGRPAVGSRP